MTKAKSDRLKIREMELEYELTMSREKRIAELLANPRIFYTVAMMGSAGLAYLAGLAVSATSSASTGGVNSAGLPALPEGIRSPLAGLDKMLGGTGGIDSKPSDGVNSLASLFMVGAASGAGFFGMCLVLHEIFGGEGSTMGEGLAQGLASSLGGLGAGGALL